MKISLFSESLFALSLDEAVLVTRDAGYPAIEIGCKIPHFDLEMAKANAEGVAGRIAQAGLAVSALSLYDSFTDQETLEGEVEAAETFIHLAPLFKTKIIKLTPGRPSSTEATDAHWQHLKKALDRLIPLAEEVGVRLAFETHMRQLTDTMASSMRLLEMAQSKAVGLTVDFSNLRFAGESMPDVLSAFKGRIYNTHVKNGYIDPQGGWHFQALDTGMTDYLEVLPLLRDAGYDGYLTVECLGADAKDRPAQTVSRDLEILKRYLGQVGWDGTEGGRK